ncbi:hypothetical protein JCM6882_002227 [Rhodosporidiobolus microsporus]
MVLLAAETLDEICAHVYADENAKLAQRTFYSLSVASRALNKVVTPWLYRRAVLVEDWKRTAWERTYLAKVDPWSLCQVAKGEVLAVQPKELVFERQKRLFCPSEDARDLYSLISDAWPDWTVFTAAGFFDNLTSLSILDGAVKPRDVFALLAPGTQLRTRIRHFHFTWPQLSAHRNFAFKTFFLLEALEFLDLSRHTRVIKHPVDYPESYYSEQEGVPAWCAHHPLQPQPPSPGEKLYSAAPAFTIQRAHFDITTFCQIFHRPHTVRITTGRGMLAKPEAAFPFLQLVSLTIPVSDERHIFLLFYTGAFPALRDLALHGELDNLFPETIQTMRFSLTRTTFSLDRLIPPKRFVALNLGASEEDRTEIGWVDGTWAPMTDDEVEVYELKPYRGPNLEKLDMGRLEVVL